MTHEYYEKQAELYNRTKIESYLNNLSVKELNYVAEFMENRREQECLTLSKNIVLTNEEQQLAKESRHKAVMMVRERLTGMPLRAILIAVYNYLDTIENPLA